MCHKRTLRKYKTNFTKTFEELLSNAKQYLHSILNN